MLRLKVIALVSRLPAGAFDTVYGKLTSTCCCTCWVYKYSCVIFQGLFATMGNTEAIRPLHTLYLLGQESSVHNVFIISDGHVNNGSVLLDNVRRNAEHTRIFTLGVRYLRVDPCLGVLNGLPLFGGT